MGLSVSSVAGGFSPVSVSSLFAWLDPTRGKTEIDATIVKDLSDPAWTKSGPLVVTSNGDGTYQFSDDGTGGTATRLAQDAIDVQLNHPATLVFDVKPDALSWFRFRVDGGGTIVYLNGTTGAHTVGAGSPSVSSVAISGGYRFTVTFTATSSALTQLYPTDSDATANSTLASGQDALDVEIVSITQTRLSNWDDQVRTNPLDMTQAVDASMPVVSSDTPPRIGYDGVDDCMQTALAPSNYSFLHNGTGGTIVFVVRPNDVAAAAVQLYPNTSSGPGVPGVRPRLAAGSAQLDVDVHDGSVAIASTLSTAFTAGRKYIVIVRFVSTSLKTQWLDELGGTDTQEDATVSAPTAADSDLFTIGANAAGTANFADADFGDILLFSEYLSDGQVNQVVTYLKSKWGFA
jgi:hypothetical protein